MSEGSQRRRCEFQLLRYVPDAVRNEFVHIGVILREQEDGAPLHTEVRFTRDWRRVRCLDPDADTTLFESMESELRVRLREQSGGDWMRRFNDAFSTCVQLTEPKAYLAESLPAGMEELMRIYVEPRQQEKVRRQKGRGAILTEMRTQFERAGVWELLRKRIAVSDYIQKPDSLHIDLGYRPNGIIRMFHAVSLESGPDPAKLLAFSEAGLRTGVERVEKAGLELTAIIEPAAKVEATDEQPDRLALYRFGVETMEEHHIRVLTTSDLGRVAETARRELVGGQ